VQLRRRVGSYWRELGDRPRLASMVRAVTRIEALVCESEHEAAWLERNLLEHRMPRANRTAGGQEVPMFIRLDRTPRTAGTRAVYEIRHGDDAVHFGPYLGSLRVRLAVSALHRVHPLGYAGTALTDAECDMARLRGVAPARRAELADAVTAVLARDPGAVAAARAELVARRDRAAGSAAYELAGRIQQEIEALEWVVAPQRVTTIEPVDAVACGWHDGQLVTLTVHGGRLREWHLRTCAESAGRARAATTPPGWADFAHRNAALAASLAVAGG
jgi:excinuclease ABC subunit C